MIREADHAHAAATELEALVSLLPSEKSRQLAQLQVKASHKQAKDFRELAQRVKESQWSPSVRCRFMSPPLKRLGILVRSRRCCEKTLWAKLS